MWRLAVLGLVLTTGVVRDTRAAMVTPCVFSPHWPQMFVADDINRCVFYVCASGGRRAECAPGSGLHPDYFMDVSNPCTEKVTSCTRHPPSPHPPVTRYPASTPTPADTPAVIMSTMPPDTTTMHSHTTGMPGSTPCPTSHRPILDTFPGTHISGGEADPAIISVSDCYVHCSSQPTCHGFDWDYVNRSCWLHRPVTECTPLLPMDGVFHYRLVPCGASVNDGMHVSGGVYRPDVIVLDACVATCREPCKGLDFDSALNSCWHHFENSECNPLTPKPSCVHIRLRDPTCMDAASTSTPRPTTRVAVLPSARSPEPRPFSTVLTATPARRIPPAPTASAPPNHVTSPPPPPATTRLASTASATSRGTRATRPPPAPQGFVLRESDRCIPGGILLSFEDSRGNRLLVTEQDCLEACLERNTCFGVDYDSSEGACRVHSRSTVCERTVVRRGCRHYSRVVCDYTDKDGGSGFLAIFEGKHVLRGSQLNNTYTKEECQQICLDDTQCEGVDYNQVSSTCWRHTQEDECMVPKQKRACTHYRKMSC